MHAHQMRVSQASHEMMNPPEAAAPVEMSLTDAQLSTFWARIVENREAACRVAARFVSKESAEDIVHTAAVLFVEYAQRRSKSPEPFPADPNRFRSKFLTAVRNHAFDCVRDSKRPACPVHSYWGYEPEPELGGHNLADRELDTLFARNDDGKYDAPVPTVHRAADDLNGLYYILRNHMEDLSETEREIIHEAFLEERARDEIAARRGISLNTYDNHRKAACRKLRESMMAVVEGFSDIDLPQWYDRIEEMNKRHAASQRRRASRKKEKGSSSGGDRPNFECSRSNSRGDPDKNARARDESVRAATKS